MWQQMNVIVFMITGALGFGKVLLFLVVFTSDLFLLVLFFTS